MKLKRKYNDRKGKKGNVIKRVLITIASFKEDSVLPFSGVTILVLALEAALVLRSFLSKQVIKLKKKKNVVCVVTVVNIVKWS